MKLMQCTAPAQYATTVLHVLRARPAGSEALMSMLNTSSVTHAHGSAVCAREMDMRHQQSGSAVL